MSSDGPRATCPYLPGARGPGDAPKADIARATHIVEKVYAALDSGDIMGALSHFTPEAVFETRSGRAEGIRGVARMLESEQDALGIETLHALADIVTRELRHDVVEVKATLVCHVRGGEAKWTVAQAIRARHMLRYLQGRWMLTARIVIAPETHGW